MPDLVTRLRHAVAGRYLIERELGRGGMATVYLARDLRHQRPVAIKVLSPDIAATIGADRFTREIAVAAQLVHPHILALFDSGEAGGLCYYVMPCVTGESLQDRLAREGPLPIDDAVRIAREVLAALDCAHRHGIIHRDIKPANILLHEGSALVADFGIALVLGGLEQGRLTSTGLSLGTPVYMSPEQASGAAQVDARADLYSLGCVLYEMLAGEPPFSGPTVQAVIARRFATPPVPLRALRPTVPGWLDGVVAKALALVPGDRFPSAAEFAKALATPGAESPTHAGRSEARRRWSRLTRWGAAGALLAAGLLAGRRWLARPAGGDRLLRPRSIAVLPFVSPDQDAGNAYFGAGIAEALTTALARNPELRVASSDAAGRYRQAGRSDEELARGLDVQAILEGTVRRVGNHLRVTARLVDPSQGTVLWAEKYDRQQADIFAVQDDITQAIVAALAPASAPFPNASGRPDSAGDTARTVLTAMPKAGSRTTDPETYELYLRGRYQWRQRGGEQLRAAIRLYEEALARDSSFAPAWAGLSMAQVVAPFFANLRADSLLELASRNADRALALDSTLADAHLARAYALKGQWRWEESEQEFLRALLLAPQDATIHHWYGFLLHATGRIPEALAQLEQARRLDPLDLQTQVDHFYVLYLSRRYQEALAEGKHIRALDPMRSDAALQLGMIELALARPDSALADFERAEQLGSGFAMGAFESVAARRVGQARRADSLYATLLARYGRDPSLAYAVAVAAAAAGDIDRGIQAIEGTVRTRALFATEFNLPCEPLLDPLRRDPRFARALEGAGMRVCGER